jgi:signal transduction histidine kinase
VSSPLLATDQHKLVFSTSQLRRRSRSGLISLVRALPIRWRILTIAGVNAAVVLILAGLIWNGAKELSRAWDEVLKVRESDRVLALLESEAGRLQNLIHRYINQPSPQIFAEILLLREAVLGTLRSRGASDPMLAGSVGALEHATDRFLAGFGDLRAEQAATAKTYEEQVLAPAREMSGLYAIIDSSVGRRDSLIWPPLGKSREAFAAMLVAANSYYLSLASDAADEARTHLETIERTIPVLLDLAENDLQRVALKKLGERAATLRTGLATLAENFARRAHLLRTAIDANQAAMIGAIDEVSGRMRRREQQAQTHFDATLADIYRKVVIVAVAFGSATIMFGFMIALSIRQPLRDLMAAMQAITSNNYEHHIQGTDASDEIGEMARAAEVFRENAIARQKAENELRTSKDRAEKALADLQAARQDLIDAERLAALGGLVAGIAHEVNNPIGISLTVASSFASRAEAFERELGSDTPLRRSRLQEFVAASGDAARQLVANLHRAAELIQSFKQVAVDRSHAERRQFDLQEATDQIIASLRPALKKSRVDLSVTVPEGLMVDSYPGAYGQVLTNLFLNALTHAFPKGRDGSIDIRAQAVDNRYIEISITDDGAGMTPDVLRQAFDPFFTTRRSEGGTGLGLHIVYNLVTQQLGGRMTLASRPGQGTMFRITLPRSAPREPAEPATPPPNG